jgi:hypothetical protein
MQEVRNKPIRDYFTGTVGVDHACAYGGTGIKIINDAAETIAVTVGDLTFNVKQNENFADDFLPFTTVTIDPTTSLGTKQVETATLAVGNVSTAGDMAVIVTAAGMTGTPKTILVPVTLADVTPALIMAKVRAALAADTAITAMFTVSGATNTVILTAIRGKANDATLNVDLGGTGTTAVGITRVAASADTTGGVAATTVGYRCWVRG